MPDSFRARRILTRKRLEARAELDFLGGDVQEKGASRGKRSAEVIGGGAALGALIGGLAGGGKGAAIGAGVGAGGGTAVQALTKGQQVKIPTRGSGWEKRSRIKDG